MTSSEGRRIEEKRRGQWDTKNWKEYEHEE